MLLSFNVCYLQLLSLFSLCLQHTPLNTNESTNHSYSFVHVFLCFAADSLFGTALPEQFVEGDNVPAPPVLVRCTTELEKRLQETGVYSHCWPVGSRLRYFLLCAAEKCRFMFP